MPALTSSAPVASPARILVRGVNWLGDAVMTTPALQRLRERFPAARITLATPAKLAALWLHHPSLDHLVVLEAGEGVWAVGRRLRPEQCELALLFPNSLRSALECWLGGIPRRVGRARRWRDGFLTQAVPPRPGQIRMHKRSPREIRELNSSPGPHRPTPPPETHQIYDYLHLTAALGASAAPLPPRVTIAPPEIEKARLAFLPDWPANSPVPLLGLNPGAEYGPAKRWPAAHFIAAAREISRRLGPCRWLVFGAARDVPLCDEIVQGVGEQALNLAGRTSLRDLMGLLKLCRVLLTNDTGPMHLAAALDTPVVVPFGSTSPLLTGPGLPGDPRHQLLLSDAPCAPCFRRVCPIDFRCLTGIRPESVAAVVLATIGGSRSAR